MKKFLSIFIAVAMVMSFAAVFANAPTAMAAAPTTVTLDAGALDYLEWYGETMPSFGSEGVYHILPALTADPTKYIYNMGEGTIDGELDAAVVGTWKVELLKTDLTTVIDTVNMAGGGTTFSIGTGNVSEDGEYVVRASGGNISGNIDTHVFIKYNIGFDNKDVAVSDCTVFPTSKTISGWITRGSGQTVLVPVDVYVSYPTTDDGTPGGALAGYYTVAENSSGQFSITFPITAGTPTGDFHVYVRDGYVDTNQENDAMIYTTLNNTPAAKTVTLSTYVSPSILYKDLAAQPFIIVAKDGNDDYVTGLLQADFTVKYNDGTGVTVSSFKEISPGFYKFYLTTDNAAGHGDVRFSTTATADYSASSNTVIVGLRNQGVFNPYVDVDVYYAIPDYGVGYLDYLAQHVYDKLPCTIGNALEINVDVWPVTDPANWYLYDISSEVWSYITENGEKIDNHGVIDISVDGVIDNRYLVVGNGTIEATIDVIAWERVDTTCLGTNGWTNYQDPTDGQLYEMSTNACCHDEYHKSFRICTVLSCDISDISLSNGEETNANEIEVGKKSNLNISPKNKKIEYGSSNLYCGCPYYVVWAYMVDEDGNKLDDAFTVDQLFSDPIKVTDLWYNPQHAVDTGIDDIPITFGESTPGELTDCPYFLEGIAFNYPTDTDCGYHLVVKYFGKLRTYDACGAPSITWPMVGEKIDPIIITPAITSLTATATISEGEIDPTVILAGVVPTIDITDPGFTLGTPEWEYSFNGIPLLDYNTDYGWNTHVTHSIIDTGYRFTFDCPIPAAGTFTIRGYVYDDDCVALEEVIIDFEVVEPDRIHPCNCNRPERGRGRSTRKT